MLELLRRKARSPIIQAAIVIIILVFIFWLPKMGGDGGGPDTVATVNGQPVSGREFQRLYEQTLNQYREQLGGVIPAGLLESLGIRQQVLNQLIQETLLRQGAVQSGLLVSDEEVQAMIHAMETFRQDGIFNLARYKETLALSRLSPQEFENSIRADLQRSKIISHLAAFARVSDEEVREWFSRDHDELKLSYLTFKADEFRAQVTIEEEALSKFFQERADNYRSEPQVRLAYLRFSRGDHRALEVSEAEIEDYYRRNPEQYEIAPAPGATAAPDLRPLAEVREEIRVTLQAAKAKQQAFSQASEAYEKIITLGGLEQGAQALGLSLQKSELFSRAKPPAELAAYPALLNTAFRLRQGELSSIVEIRDGYGVLFVKERQEPRAPELAAVRGRVEDDFRVEQAGELARQAAADLLAAVKGGEELAVAARKAGKSPAESAWFSRRNVAQAGLPAPVAQAGLQVTASAPLVETVSSVGTEHYVIRLLDQRPAPEAEFQRQAEIIRGQLLQAKQLALIDGWVTFLQTQGKIEISPDF